jgi:hypothetical protein
MKVTDYPTSRGVTGRRSVESSGTERITPYEQTRCSSHLQVYTRGSGVGLWPWTEAGGVRTQKPMTIWTVGVKTVLQQQVLGRHQGEVLGVSRRLPIRHAPRNALTEKTSRGKLRITRRF